MFIIRLDKLLIMGGMKECYLFEISNKIIDVIMGEYMNCQRIKITKMMYLIDINYGKVTRLCAEYMRT